jgi:hypothetical protein
VCVPCDVDILMLSIRLKTISEKRCNKVVICVHRKLKSLDATSKFMRCSFVEFSNIEIYLYDCISSFVTTG